MIKLNKCLLELSEQYIIDEDLLRVVEQYGAHITIRVTNDKIPYYDNIRKIIYINCPKNIKKMTDFDKIELVLTFIHELAHYIDDMLTLTNKHHASHYQRGDRVLMDEIHDFAEYTLNDDREEKQRCKKDIFLKILSFTDCDCIYLMGLQDYVYCLLAAEEEFAHYMDGVLKSYNSDFGYHDRRYLLCSWSTDYAIIAAELFANQFAMVALNDQDGIDFIKRNVPGIYRAVDLLINRCKSKEYGLKMEKKGLFNVWKMIW